MQGPHRAGERSPHAHHSEFKKNKGAARVEGKGWGANIHFGWWGREKGQIHFEAGAMEIW